MQDLYLSLSSNKLRISTVNSKSGFSSVTEELTHNVAKNSSIVDTFTFGSILAETISKVTGLSKNKLLLNVIVEPENTVVTFFTIPKSALGNEELALGEIKKKIGDVDLNHLFYSYKRIAPFLYQFVGINKKVLEAWIEVSNNIGIGLKSLVPWNLLLPKYAGVTDPSVFLSKRDDKQVMSLSELNGTFYTGVYEQERSSKELQDLLKSLSFYKKSETIKKVFTLGYESFKLSDFEVAKVELPVSEINTEESPGFEINLLTNFMMDKDPSLVFGQLNLLNLLPVPVVEGKKSPMVYVVPALVATCLIAAVIFFVGFGKKNVTSGSLAENNQAEQNVLSETKSSTESANSNSAPEQPKPPELKRSDLKVRVENATGVSGLAAKTEVYLKGLGYNVVSIGTADSTKKNTVLTLKPEAVKYKDLVISDVTPKIPGLVVEGSLGPSVGYDLLVVLGGISDLK